MKAKKLFCILLGLLALVGSSFGKTTSHGAATSSPIQLVSPNGGEVFVLGASCLIEWKSQSEFFQKIEILMSKDGGKTYPIELAVLKQQKGVAEESYKLEKLAFSGEKMRVMVRAITQLGAVFEDASDKDFRIVELEEAQIDPKLLELGAVRTPDRPTDAQVIFGLLSPNGGEIFVKGSSQLVRWMLPYNSETYRIDLLLSKDGGKTFPTLLKRILKPTRVERDPLDEAIEMPESWLWKDIQEVGQHLRIAIHVYTKDMVYNDRSDKDFAVVNYLPRERIISENPLEPSQSKANNLVKLDQNYPNPFNPTTQISFELIESGLVNLTVYNTLGQSVASLVNETLSAGKHTAMFDATNLPSGMYVYRLSAQGMTIQKPMILTK